MRHELGQQLLMVVTRSVGTLLDLRLLVGTRAVVTDLVVTDLIVTDMVVAHLVVPHLPTVLALSDLR